MLYYVRVCVCLCVLAKREKLKQSNIMINKLTTYTYE